MTVVVRRMVHIVAWRKRGHREVSLRNKELKKQRDIINEGKELVISFNQIYLER